MTRNQAYDNMQYELDAYSQALKQRGSPTLLERYRRSAADWAVIYTALKLAETKCQ